MGQAAADGVHAFEKRKLVLNHLVISSLLKHPSKLMLKTHLSTWICGSGAWTVHGNGGWQVRSTCHHLLWAVTTSCSCLLLSAFSHGQRNNALCYMVTLWKYLVGSHQRSPGVALALLRVSRMLLLLLLLTTQCCLWELSCVRESNTTYQVRDTVLMSHGQDFFGL